jgi:hypothetical protein
MNFLSARRLIVACALVGMFSFGIITTSKIVSASSDRPFGGTVAEIGPAIAITIDKEICQAMNVLRDLHLAIPVASLAKREEEIFVPDSSDPVALPKNAPAQFLLQRLRDEAHRFANVIREKQGKNAMLQSGFDAVDGIGPKTRALLLKKFGSMDAAKQASDDELKRLLNTSQLKAFRKKLG